MRPMTRRNWTTSNGCCPCMSWNKLNIYVNFFKFFVSWKVKSTRGTLGKNQQFDRLLTKRFFFPFQKIFTIAWGWGGWGGPPFRLELRYWLEVNPKWPTVLSHWRHPIERGSKGEENRGNSSLAYLSWVYGNKTLLLISLSGPYWKGVALLIDPFWKPVAFVYYFISNDQI